MVPAPKPNHQVAGSGKRGHGVGERILILHGIDARVPGIADALDELVAVEAVGRLARGINRRDQYGVGLAEAAAEAVEQGLRAASSDAAA